MTAPTGQGQVWESPLAALITGPKCTHLEHGLSHRPTLFLGLLREAKEGAFGREFDKSQYFGQILGDSVSSGRIPRWVGFSSHCGLHTSDDRELSTSPKVCPILIHLLTQMYQVPAVCW